MSASNGCKYSEQQQQQQQLPTITAPGPSWHHALQHLTALREPSIEHFGSLRRRTSESPSGVTAPQFKVFRGRKLVISSTVAVAGLSISNASVSILLAAAGICHPAVAFWGNLVLYTPQLAAQKCSPS